MRTRTTNSPPPQLTPSAAPKRILVPLDFSVCSLAALGHALTFAKLCHAEIVLVHVVEPMHPGSMLESSKKGRLHNLALHEAEHRLAKGARTGVKPHAPLRYLVRAGNPFVVVTDSARKTASDLIFLGTHGHTGFPTVLLGKHR